MCKVGVKCVLPLEGPAALYILPVDAQLKFNLELPDFPTRRGRSRSELFRGRNGSVASASRDSHTAHAILAIDHSNHIGPCFVSRFDACRDKIAAHSTL